MCFWQQLKGTVHRSSIIPTILVPEKYALKLGKLSLRRNIYQGHAETPAILPVFCGALKFTRPRAALKGDRMYTSFKYHENVCFLS
jgi:hypothetical protein